MNCATLPVHSMVIPTVQMRKPWLKEFIQFTGGVGASLVAQMVKNLPAMGLQGVRHDLETEHTDQFIPCKNLSRPISISGSM